MASVGINCFIARKQNVSNGNANADELPNIQFSLTPVGMPRYQVFRPILFIRHGL